MKKQLLSFLLFLFTLTTFSQIKGTVSSTKNDNLPFVNIYIENTFTGTTSNEDGFYELEYNKKGKVTIVFQYLGYKTLKKTVDISSFPFTLDAVLQSEDISLDQVVIKAEENPANQIIRNAIANRKTMLNKIRAFKADFYSRGLMRIKNAPEKILGQEVGDLGGGLDSTRSGVIYLSETISKLQFQRPDNLKETIIASKVSGDDNGFSFNTASDVDFNFYNNTIELGNQIVSPIADFAFNYYRYKLLGVFYDDRGNLINKIQVIPRRENDRIFSGTIYIIEDQWSIYGLELDITGEQAQIPAAKIITLKQTFSYSESNKIWALISQSIDFGYAFLGIKGDGRFTAVYSNYNFSPTFNKSISSNEILSFQNDANKKDSTYWQTVRPVPLTSEEIRDYVKKDSIQTLKESKPYKDSVDRANNRFKIFDLITGYSYQNSFKDYRFTFSGPLRAMSFNTVQGYNARADFGFRKNYDEYKKYLDLRASLNYSISDKRIRPTASATYKFNNVNRPYLSISGGNKVQQFNPSNPISRSINSSASLFFEDNYMKLYDLSFVNVSYSQEVINGLRLYGTVQYENRKPLFNTANNVANDRDDKTYTSNNPLDPTNFTSAPFEKHHIYKANLSARINFGQKYMSYPGTKFNITNDKFPILFFDYEKGFGASNSNYNFDQLKVRLYQNVTLSNKGNLTYNLKGGTFFNAENIAFMDYQHFNGNQTHIATSNKYVNQFNNLPYYALSTNDNYAEFHAEHNFKGYILGKIPLLNKLNFNLVIGAHNLATKNRKPYQEYSIGLDNLGWGNFRFLRFDYVRSYQGGYQSDALVFGLKFLNFID